MAEAIKLREVSLEDALELVHLDAVRGSSKYERAALRWLRRYLDEDEPSLERFASVVASLAEVDAGMGASGERIGALPGIREWAAIEEED